MPSLLVFTRTIPDGADAYGVYLDSTGEPAQRYYDKVTKVFEKTGDKPLIPIMAEQLSLWTKLKRQMGVTSSERDEIHQLYKEIIGTSEKLGYKSIVLPLLGIEEGYPLHITFGILFEHVKLYEKKKLPPGFDHVTITIKLSKAASAYLNNYKETDHLKVYWKDIGACKNPYGFPLTGIPAILLLKTVQKFKPKEYADLQCTNRQIFSFCKENVQKINIAFDGTYMYLLHSSPNPPGIQNIILCHYSFSTRQQMKIWNVDEEDILPEIGWFKLNTIILKNETGNTLGPFEEFLDRLLKVTANLCPPNFLQLEGLSTSQMIRLMKQLKPKSIELGGVELDQEIMDRIKKSQNINIKFTSVPENYKFVTHEKGYFSYTFPAGDPNNYSYLSSITEGWKHNDWPSCHLNLFLQRSFYTMWLPGLRSIIPKSLIHICCFKVPINLPRQHGRHINDVKHDFFAVDTGNNQCRYMKVTRQIKEGRTYTDMWFTGIESKAWLVFELVHSVFRSNFPVNLEEELVNAKSFGHMGQLLMLARRDRQ